MRMNHRLQYLDLFTIDILSQPLVMRMNGESGGLPDVSHPCPLSLSADQ